MGCWSHVVRTPSSVTQMYPASKSTSMTANILCSCVHTTQFARNGGCGYVLKPDWMLQGVPGFGGPAAAAAQRTISGSPPTNPLPDRPAKKLRVHVHSAYADQGMGCMCFKDDLFLQVRACMHACMVAAPCPACAPAACALFRSLNVQTTLNSS